MAEHPGASSQPVPTPSTESRNEGMVPTLRDLSLLPVPNWYFLGLQLGVSGDELDIIERNYPRDNHMGKVKMFGTWLRMGTNATYRKLARALVTVGKRNIAETLCTERGIPLRVLDDVPVATVDPSPPPPTLPPDPPECVARYAKYLRDKYKRMSTIPDGDWPPSLGRQYTRLALIEQERKLPGAELVATMERDYIHGNIDNIVKRKKAIQLPEIFLPPEDGGQQLKILMDGAPGVGKSTLSRKICKDWASGKLLQQYHLVILLPLRQASIREANSIEDLIKTDSPHLQQQVVHHIQETFGEHILLILDGYDELSNEDRTQKSLFLEIVQGDKFPKCSVLVTSRPYASDYLQQLQSINRHIEVLGFTEEQIKHCIMENIPDQTKASELVQMLKERQDITSLCYIPLNCAIVLYVYEREQCTLPRTLTKLYEIFILNAVKRHASIAGNDTFVRTLHTLAGIPTSLQVQLNALSKLAYDGLVADKMVYTIKDIEVVFSDCSDLDMDNNLLGLMTVFKWFTSTGMDLSYQFLHLTIQEFLAAKWAASQLSADGLLKFFQDHMGEGRYRMVQLFLAGISQLKFAFVDKIFQNEFVTPSVDTKAWHFLSHLIYESQNLSLFHNLGKRITHIRVTSARSPFDWLMEAHYLAWCGGSWEVDYSRQGLTSQSLEILHRVNIEHHGTTQIDKVNLSSNHPGILTKLSLLPKMPMFEHTRKLTLHVQEFPEESPHHIELHCLLNMRHLTILQISLQKIPDSSKEGYSLSLAKSVEALRNTTELQVLQFQNAYIDSKNAIDIMRQLEHNTSLVELDLSGNSQLAEGDSETVGCAIEKMLKVNRKLKVLNLSDCQVTDSIVKHILTGLTNNITLVTLHIKSPKLSGSCAVSLLQQITTHPTLTTVGVLRVESVKLDKKTVLCAECNTNSERWVEFFRALYDSGMKVSNLNVQGLTDQTAEHFAVGLAESQSVQALKLELCNISSAGAVSIFRSLEHNTSLEELDQSKNRGLAEGDSETVGCVIEGMLKVNTTLKLLNLSGCELDTTVITHIAAGLAHNASLVELNIGGSIFSEGCVHLFKALSSNISLKKLDISGNNLGMEGSVALAEMLSCNKSLTELNLTECSIPEAGLREIARRLLQNTSLKKLDISGIKLGMEGSVALAEMLACKESLTELDLRLCGIPEAGLREIARGLFQNTSLKKLDISGNKLGMKGSVALAEMLSCNKSLTELNLGCFGIPEAGQIARGLLHNSLLKKLDIGIYYNLKIEDSLALGQMLSCNNSITKLNVICGYTAEAGLREIARGLQHNTSLKKLIISKRKLGMEESAALAEMLSCNKSLTELDLSTCVIPEGEIRKMARGLDYNTSLKKLKINRYRLGIEESVALAVMLSCNKSLAELDLGWGLIPTPGLRAIACGLLQNTSLQTLVITDESKTILEAEIEILKRSGNCTPQSLSRLEIKIPRTKHYILHVLH